MITLYMIQCQTPKHIYVGISSQHEHRIEMHSIGNGASFTKKHGVKNHKVISEHDTDSAAKAAERKAVIAFRKLGYIVAGAGWTKTAK